MIRRILLLLLLLFTVGPVFSQDQATVDSLLRVTKQSQDSVAVKAYLGLSQAYMSTEYEKSLAYAKSGLELSQKMRDDFWQGRCWFQMGTVSFMFGYLKESVDQYNSAVTIFQKKGGSRYWLAKSLNGMGNAQRPLGRVKEATDSYLAAKKIFEQLQDKKGIAGTYNNLGIIFMAEGQPEKAIDYYRIARRMNVELNNQPWLAKNLSNIGTAFYNLQRYDSAEVYFREALGVYIAVNDSDGWATDVMNLGNVFTSKKNYRGAMEQFDLARSYYRRVGNEPDLGFVLYNIGGLYTETGDYVTAKSYLDSAFAISTQYNNFVSLIEIYKGYTVMYAKTGDYKNAYKYYELYATKKDSITSSDMKNQMDQMEESLREEKLREMNESLLQAKRLQDVELNRSNIIGYAAIGGIVLVLLLAFTLFKRYQLKKKANDLLKERHREIQSQKAEIEQKNLDISDSINYAQKIQGALLPDAASLQNIFSDSFIFFRPRDVVSGDFYWFFTRGSQTFLAVADCTGHGVPGALMSMLGMEKLNQAIDSGLTQPAEILSMINRELKKVLRQDEHSGGMRDGMDLALVKIDHDARSLEYAGANRPAWIIRNGEVLDLEPTKAAIGGFTPSSQEFAQQTLPLQQGDRLFLFSDGYADQFGGPKQKKMMTRKFREILRLSAEKSMSGQHHIVVEEFDRWKGSLEQVDDVCVVGVLF